MNVNDWFSGDAYEDESSEKLIQNLKDPRN